MQNAHHGAGGSYVIDDSGARTLRERTKEQHDVTGSDTEAVTQAQADQAGAASVPYPAETQAHHTRKK